jgi:hypothetical protein
MIYGEVDCWDSAKCGVYGHWGDYPDKYAAMLARVSPELKAIDSDIKIVMGNLGLVRNRASGFEPTFFSSVMTAGAWRYVDAFAFNYFPAQAVEWQSYGRDILGKIYYLRGVMNQYSEAATKDLICTEIVAESGKVDPVTGRSDAATANAQAMYITKVYSRAHVGGMSMLMYLGVQEWDTKSGVGLIYPSGERKPAWYAYNYFASSMKNTRLAGLVYNSDLGPNVETAQIEGYRFSRLPTGGEVWIVWSDTDTVTAVVSARQFDLRDKLGVQLPFTAVGENSYSFTLSPEPVYLELTR